MIHDPSDITGTRVFSDAAWKQQNDHLPSPAGLGIFMQVEETAIARSCSSLLATKLIRLLQIQEASFFTDCSTLVKSVEANDVLAAPGHWEVRPQLAAILNSSDFDPRKVHHISRCYNFKAHFQASLAIKIQDRVYYRCLASRSMNSVCPISATLMAEFVASCKLLYVKCC